MKVKEFAHSLKVGDVLANGETVQEFGTIGFDVFISTETGLKFFEQSAVIDLAQETNCLYGGLFPGHSKGFCTAHSCY